MSHIYIAISQVKLFETVIPICPPACDTYNYSSGAVIPPKAPQISPKKHQNYHHKYHPKDIRNDITENTTNIT